MSDVPASPAAPEPPSTPPAYDFGKPFSYVFDDPRWMPKVLLGGVFSFLSIVIIGWFFVLGYMARTARNIVAGMDEPLPEWENLGEFFSEGARLVAVAFCYILPILVVSCFFVVPMILSDFADDDFAFSMSGCFAGTLSCVIMPLSLLVFFFMPASLLFAAVEQRFGAAFEFGRIWAFIKANIGNYLLAIVILIIARFIGGLGFFLLCIGVFFTAFWASLIMTHGFAQAYKLARR